MIELLILIVVNSLVCIGFFKATSFNEMDAYEFDTPNNAYRCETTIVPTGKNILWWIRWYGGTFLPEWVKKPLYQCPTCMASVHSLIPFTLYMIHTGQSLWFLAYLPFHILAVSAVNTLIMINNKNI